VIKIKINKSNNFFTAKILTQNVASHCTRTSRVKY